jgi:hypothetical protein
VRLFNADGATLRYVNAVPVETGLPQLAAMMFDARPLPLVSEGAGDSTR